MANRWWIKYNPSKAFEEGVGLTPELRGALAIVCDLIALTGGKVSIHDRRFASVGGHSAKFFRLIEKLVDLKIITREGDFLGHKRTETEAEIAQYNVDNWANNFEKKGPVSNENKDMDKPSGSPAWNVQEQEHENKNIKKKSN